MYLRTIVFRLEEKKMKNNLRSTVLQDSSVVSTIESDLMSSLQYELITKSRTKFRKKKPT